ncbi:MAG: N-acetyltransferase family protein [Halioglobus sp.]
MTIRAARAADGKALADIYNHYIINSMATFEEEVLSAVDIEQRMDAVADLGLPWLVAEEEGQVIGYAYANRWRERSAYRFSVESTVYLSPDVTSRGWGTRLYAALLDELRSLNVHAVIGGITLPNPASVALHERLGMTKVAEFPEVGFKQGQWLAVGYWQVNL